MTFTMLPMGRSVLRSWLHKIWPVAALASAPALIRSPVGPEADFGVAATRAVATDSAATGAPVAA